MNIERFYKLPLLAPEHGGDTVKGGGPADSPATPEEEIAEATGRAFVGHGKTPGTGDPGVPGSKTNPIGQDTPPTGEKEGEHPMPSANFSASGS